MTLDPKEALRRILEPDLPRRFYERAEAGEAGGRFVVLLDGRPAKTPGRRALATAERRIAERLAAEWAAQAAHVDPATMPMTRLVVAAVDGVEPDPAPARAEIVKYAGSDLVCYRAGEPEGLVLRQAEAWDPVLAWAREALGARFVLSEGVMFVAQPPASLAAVKRAVEGFEGLRLAALHTATTLTGSALLALALSRGQLDAEAAWAAAHVDEDWNRALWGEDAESAARRARRFTDMAAAAEVLRGS
jgi:chaperone required for assembly of F1-ATPase